MKKVKIPITDSISELAAFFDTHEYEQYADDLVVVKRPSFARHAVINLQLKAREATAIAKMARSQDLSPEELVHQWIRQKLAERVKPQPASRNGSSTRRQPSLPATQVATRKGARR